MQNIKATVVPWGMFEECSDLENIELPKKLEFLGDSCLSGTLVKSINLPRKVTKIPDISNTEITCFCDNIKLVTTTSKKVKLQQKSLDLLLEENKSFKDVNKLYKQNLNR